MLEDLWLDRLIYWYRGESQFIDTVTEQSHVYLKLYEETQDETYLTLAEQSLGMAAYCRARKPEMLKEITNQRKRVQWINQRSLSVGQSKPSDSSKNSDPSS